MEQSKRDFIKRAGFLGAAGLIAASPSASARMAQAGATNTSIFNVKDFGAKGDGKTPDSEAIQKALDEAGKVQGTTYFPSGNYLCHDLKVSSFTTVLADPQWAYRPNSGAMLTIDSEEAECVLNISHTFGCHIRGIVLRGNRRAQKVQHGIFAKHEDFSNSENLTVIDEVASTLFSGHGLYLQKTWVFIVRRSIFISNKGSGACINGWDGFIIDNMFSGNGKSGFDVEDFAPTVMFTANRVEWNGEYGLLLTGSDCWNVTGNSFDRNYGAGIFVKNVSNASFTGNNLRRNGKDAVNAQEGVAESCQMLIQSSKGLSVTGNTGAARNDDGGKGEYTPNYVFWLKDNACTIITANAFYGGYMKEMVLDKGGNAPDVLINNNVGSVLEIPLGTT